MYVAFISSIGLPNTGPIGAALDGFEEWFGDACGGPFDGVGEPCMSLFPACDNTRYHLHRCIGISQ